MEKHRAVQFFGDVIWWLLVNVLGAAGKKPCWSIEGTGKNILHQIFKWQRMATLLFVSSIGRDYITEHQEFLERCHRKKLHPEEITRWLAEMDDMGILISMTCLKREASRQTWFLYKLSDPAWQIGSWKVHSKSVEKSLCFFSGSHQLLFRLAILCICFKKAGGLSSRPEPSRSGQ